MVWSMYRNVGLWSTCVSEQPYNPMPDVYGLDSFELVSHVVSDLGGTIGLRGG